MRITQGVVIGIDPYSSAAAEEHDNRENVQALIGPDWHSTIQWDDLYSKVTGELDRRGLSRHARVIRMKSADAAAGIEPGFDLLHVDGNHDFDAVGDDIAAYLPKLRREGFLILDDTDWDTVWRHAETLRQRLPIVYQAAKPRASRPSWIVFRQP